MSGVRAYVQEYVFAVMLITGLCDVLPASGLLQSTSADAWKEYKSAVHRREGRHDVCSPASCTTANDVMEAGSAAFYECGTLESGSLLIASLSERTNSTGAIETHTNFASTLGNLEQFRL